MKGLAVQATASRGCSECSRARTRELTGIRAACVGEHRCWWDLRRIPETQVPRSCTFSGARGEGGPSQTPYRNGPMLDSRIWSISIVRRGLEMFCKIL